jgi:uncharacterized protein DUF1501
VSNPTRDGEGHLWERIRPELSDPVSLACSFRMTKLLFCSEIVLRSTRQSGLEAVSGAEGGEPNTGERYGDGKPYQFQFDGAPTVNDHLLMARRLVEAGCRSVTLSYGRWDSHGKNFDLMRDHGPKLDQCLSALVEDLDERGMLDDVTVIAWGEFGRTPRINERAGRDHWPQVSCALLAGGGMKTGQVIGATDTLGAEAADRPVHMQEIVSTIYHNLGIDPQATMLQDRSGRPQFLLERTEVITELVG